MTLDQAIAEEAAILTAIGIGTAFGVLVLLLIATMVIRWSSGKFAASGPQPAVDEPEVQTAEEDAEARDRALAAALAVTALLAARSRPSSGAGRDG